MFDADFRKAGADFQIASVACLSFDRKAMNVLSQQRIPRHVAFIMDGNGRWAESRGKARSEGHLAGTQAVIRTVENAFRAGVKFVTLYAFSSENWNRPAEEIQALMSLMLRFLADQQSLFIKNKIRLRTIGDLSPFPQEIRDAVEHVKSATENFEEHTVSVALNYGARDEVLRAVRNYAADVQSGKISGDSVPAWDEFSNYLWTAGIPDPDLIVRTSGEIRLSNFLLLQAAYAELYFTHVLWPDFDKDELNKALDFYASRERRFGKTSAQLQKSQQ